MTGAKVVVLAFDAVDVDLLRESVDAGEAPAFGALWSTSAWAPTLNPVGFLVGSVWPTLWSGVGPGRHGWFSNRQLVSGTYLVCPSRADAVDRPPFWVAAGAAGRPAFVLDVPLAPVRPARHCVQIGEWGGHDRRFGAASTPPTALGDLERTAGVYRVRAECDAYAAGEQWDELRDDLCAGVEQKTAATRAAIADPAYDLVISVFAEGHCAGHQLWPARRAHLGDVYRALDGGLGVLLEAAGPEATVVVLLSHGIGAPHGGDHLLGEVLRRLDDAYGPPGRVAALGERVRRPIARRRLERRLRRRFPDDPARWEVTSVDGARRFFRVPSVGLHGAIRINLRGREPRGRVRSGPELDDLVARLRADLLDLTDPDSGDRLVADVLRTRDHYHGERIDDLPDLLVEWEVHSVPGAVASPRVGTVRGERWSGRPGEHRPPGMCFVRGPGIPAGPLADTVQAVDIAPTVLGLLGVDVADLDGHAVFGTR